MVGRIGSRRLLAGLASTKHMARFIDSSLHGAGRVFLAAVVLLFVSACMEAKMASSDRQYGVVTTFTSNVPAKIYPAYIAVIDGDSVQTTAAVGGLAARKHTFRLPPGDHKIRIVADLRNATGTLESGTTFTPRGQQPGNLELFVEEGRRYYIGARLTGARKDEWEPVIWHVEDLENYRHTIVE